MAKKANPQTQTGQPVARAPSSDKPAKKVSRQAPTKPDFAVCVVKDTAVVSSEHEYSRAFGEGALVDLSEKIANDVYLGDLVREGCFKRISAEEHTRAVEELERKKSEPKEPSEES